MSCVSFGKTHVNVQTASSHYMQPRTRVTRSANPTDKPVETEAEFGGDSPGETEGFQRVKSRGESNQKGISFESKSSAPSKSKAKGGENGENGSLPHDFGGKVRSAFCLDHRRDSHPLKPWFQV